MHYRVTPQRKFALILVIIVLAASCGGSPQTLSPNSAGNPGASVIPGALTFSAQNIGTTSAVQRVSLSNTGSAALTISNLAIAGANADDFAQTNNCGGSVPAGGDCTINVTFTPAASGNRTASFSITDNASGSPQTVPLYGGGVSSALSLNPTSLIFTNQAVFTTSPSQVITVTNAGTASVTMTSIALTGANAAEFSESNNCPLSPNTLSANALCAVTVTFEPAVAGVQTASLSITEAATNTTQTVSLAGKGTAAEATVTSGVVFGDQPVDISSAGELVTLGNTGNETLNIAGYTFTGNDSGDFAVTATTCASTLAAAGTCTFSIAFRPAAAGSGTATFVLTDNSNNTSGSTQSAALTGTGTHDVFLRWTASSSSGVMGYFVYRSETSGQELTDNGTLLTTTPVTTDAYVDTTVMAGSKYYYVITTVASNGVTQSGASSEVSATVP